MDVKPIASTQTALSMQTQNMHEVQRNEKQVQESVGEGKGGFDKLDEKNKDELIKQNVQKLNEKLQMLHTSLKIEIDKDTGIEVVKIVDEENKKVIRQIPPETMLKIAKYIDEITGLLFEKRA